MPEKKCRYKFRAITVNGKRHGLRLENHFWSILEDIAKEQMRPISSIVAEIEATHPNTTNLTSSLRVYILEWVSEQLLDLRAKTSSQKINQSVQACPSPTFVLSEKKKLYSFNSAFAKYVQIRFARGDIKGLGHELRLQLDQKTDELIDQLKSMDGASLQLGFTLGMNNQSMRGNINALLTPAWQEDLIICHVIS